MLCTYTFLVSTQRWTERNGTERNTLLTETTARRVEGPGVVYESEMQAELMHDRRKRKPAMHWEHESSEPDPIMRAGFQS